MMYIHTYVCACVCPYVYACMMYIHTYVCACVCACVYVYVCACIDLHIYVHTCICMYVHNVCNYMPAFIYIYSTLTHFLFTLLRS